MRWAAPLMLLCVAAGAHRPAQSGQGRAVYAARCAECHGRNFEGGAEDAPALVGARFEAKWRGRDAALYDKIRRSMPQDDPGILTPEQAAEVTALILAAQKGK